MLADRDTIVAPATAPGGALAVVRISGAEALACCDRIFRGRRPLAEAEGYTVHYGRIVDGERTVDDVLATVFRAPHSYTGEDAAEISCHGSSYIVSELLRLLIGAGCRMASPGEFTLRAYLAGKMDLSQAEAVADLIASSSRAAHTLASTQMRGSYSAALDTLRDELLRLTALLELELDFSEEDVTFADRGELRRTMERIGAEIDALRSTFALGNALREGVAVAIVGAPNAGKSTLLNRLAGDDRAMVSEIAGTTRDVIEERVTIDGVLFRFLDTAGIHATDDRLERMGIARTMDAIDRAAIIVRLLDATQLDRDSGNRDNARDGKRALPGACIGSPGSDFAPGAPLGCDSSDLRDSAPDSCSANRSARHPDHASGMPLDSLCISDIARTGEAPLPEKNASGRSGDDAPQTAASDLDRDRIAPQQVNDTASNADDAPQSATSYLDRIAPQQENDTASNADDVPQSATSCFDRYRIAPPQENDTTSNADDALQTATSCFDRDRIALPQENDAATASCAPSQPAPRLTLRREQRLLTVVNKIDLVPGLPLPADAIAISARQGTGIETLRNALRRNVDTSALYHGDAVVSHGRHYEALTEAREALTAALDALGSDLPADLLSEEIRPVIRALGSITSRGSIATDEVLGHIFSKFCIGK